jgi:hypothetical protein
MCPKLYASIKFQFNHFVSFPVYAHQMSYDRFINYEDPIAWSDKDAIALIHHNYTCRYQDD